MPENRDVFKIKAETNDIRFGAKFVGADNLGEKWSGEIPEMWGFEKGQVTGPTIKNSEGKEYKVNKISYKDPDGKEYDVTGDAYKKHYQKYFWIEGI